MSNELGTFQIFVVSLTPEGQSAGGKWQISSGADSGADPIWPAAGNQILYKDYKSGASRIEVVSYSVKGDSFLADPPRIWSPRPLSQFAANAFDITKDGKQAIAVVDDDSALPETHVRVILNFGDEIRRRLAAVAR